MSAAVRPRGYGPGARSVLPRAGVRPTSFAAAAVAHLRLDAVHPDERAEGEQAGADQRGVDAESHARRPAARRGCDRAVGAGVEGQPELPAQDGNEMEERARGGKDYREQVDAPGWGTEWDSMKKDGEHGEKRVSCRIKIRYVKYTAIIHRRGWKSIHHPFLVLYRNLS